MLVGLQSRFTSLDTMHLQESCTMKLSVYEVYTGLSDGMASSCSAGTLSRSYRMFNGKHRRTRRNGEEHGETEEQHESPQETTRRTPLDTAASAHAGESNWKSQKRSPSFRKSAQFEAELLTKMWFNFSRCISRLIFSFHRDGRVNWTHAVQHFGIVQRTHRVLTRCTDRRV